MPEPPSQLAQLLEGQPDTGVGSFHEARGGVGELERGIGIGLLQRDMYAAQLNLCNILVACILTVTNQQNAQTTQQMMQWRVAIVCQTLETHVYQVCLCLAPRTPA